MKTLIVTLEYPPMVGGIASYVYNFAAHLLPEEVVVYAPNNPLAKQFDAKNIWKTYRQNPYWVLVWPAWLRLFFQIWRIIKKEKITELFIHHALPVGYVGLMIKKIFKINYTIFLHGTDLEFALRNNFKKKRFKQVILETEKVIVNSEFLKQKLLSNLEFKKEVIVVHPCPAENFLSIVPDETLRKLRSQLALNGKKIILTVGRMVDGKGYPHLARILPEIAKEVSNVVWLIIGDGVKRDAVIKQIQANNLQNIVRYLGVVPPQNLPAYYQLADLFVLLTHSDEGREEGWGLSFLEAAASGLAVVAGRAGGVEEAVQNLVTGMVVDVHQDKVVTKTIVELLKNPEYASQLGIAGKNRVYQEFTWAKQLALLGK